MELEGSPSPCLKVTLQRVEAGLEPEEDDELDATLMSVVEVSEPDPEEEGRPGEASEMAQGERGEERAPTPTERELQRMQQEKEGQRLRSEQQSPARAELGEHDNEVRKRMLCS